MLGDFSFFWCFWLYNCINSNSGVPVYIECLEYNFYESKGTSMSLCVSSSNLKLLNKSKNSSYKYFPQPSIFQMS